jgi:hypothetical protein
MGYCKSVRLPCGACNPLQYNHVAIPSYGYRHYATFTHITGYPLGRSRSIGYNQFIHFRLIF